MDSKLAPSNNFSSNENDAYKDILCVDSDLSINKISSKITLSSDKADVEKNKNIQDSESKDNKICIRKTSHHIPNHNLRKDNIHLFNSNKFNNNSIYAKRNSHEVFVNENIHLKSNNSTISYYNNACNLNNRNQNIMLSSNKVENKANNSNQYYTQYLQKLAPNQDENDFYSNNKDKSVNNYNTNNNNYINKFEINNKLHYNSNIINNYNNHSMRSNYNHKSSGSNFETQKEKELKDAQRKRTSEYYLKFLEKTAKSPFFEATYDYFKKLNNPTNTSNTNNTDIKKLSLSNNATSSNLKQNINNSIPHHQNNNSLIVDIISNNSKDQNYQNNRELIRKQSDILERENLNKNNNNINKNNNNINSNSTNNQSSRNLKNPLYNNYYEAKLNKLQLQYKMMNESTSTNNTAFTSHQAYSPKTNNTRQMMLNVYNNYLIAKYPNLAELLNKYSTPFIPINVVPNSKYYIIKSFNIENIHKAIKYNTWSTTYSGNSSFNKAYIEAKNRGAEVYLFFSINSTFSFQGLARLSSKLQEKSYSFWKGSEKYKKFDGSFNLEWLIIKDVPSTTLDRVVIDNVPFSKLRNCMEVKENYALSVIKYIEGFYYCSSLVLNDFMRLDMQEKEECRT